MSDPICIGDIVRYEHEGITFTGVVLDLFQDFNRRNRAKVALTSMNLETAMIAVDSENIFDVGRHYLTKIGEHK